ncbi:MAG TPA: hypothetical protein VMT82_01105 [candidate division Zixibacteria bacterium]|jgi:F0F1-type ATP synthase membrane subunit c/vacuolar-type H+-ATPase subunit K|nr:hypothetical protein [candidate division Zixibacteria bacterium]
MNLLERTLQSLKLIHMGMLASVVIYGILGEFVLHPQPRALGSTALILVVIASSMLTFGYTARNSMVLPAEEQLRRNPNDPTLVMRWRSGVVIVMTLFEAVGLIGFVLRVLGGSPIVSILMYAISLGYLIMLGPRRP